MSAQYPAPPVDDAEGFAALASDYLDDATHSERREVQALIGVGYALLALREQLATQPPPRRRWLCRGAR